MWGAARPQSREVELENCRHGPTVVWQADRSCACLPAWLNVQWLRDHVPEHALVRDRWRRLRNIGNTCTNGLRQGTGTRRWCWPCRETPAPRRRSRREQKLDERRMAGQNGRPSAKRPAAYPFVRVGTPQAFNALCWKGAPGLWVGCRHGRRAAVPRCAHSASLPSEIPDRHPTSLKKTGNIQPFTNYPANFEKASERWRAPSSPWTC